MASSPLNSLSLFSASGTTTINLDQLVTQYQSSLTSKSVVPLQNRKTTLTARLNALGPLDTKLQALSAIVSSLAQSGSASPFQAYTVQSGDTGIATATAASGAALATHTLSVSQLAKADTLLSDELTSSDTTVAAAAGSGTKTIRLTVNGTATDIPVDLNDGDSNATILNAVATAVNASGAGVSASVVTDTPTTSRLVLSSSSTGSANALSVSDTGGTLLASLGITAGVVAGRTASTSSTAGFIYGAASNLDAKFNLDGIDVVRGTNSVSDVLKDVTLNLAGVQSAGDAPLSLTVGVDTSAITAKINSFISAYNDALSYIKAKTAVDPQTHVAEIFAYDSTMTNLRTTLQVTASQTVSGLPPGAPASLAALGITVAKDGTLSISDQESFQKALSPDPTNMEALFNSGGGIGTLLKSLLDGFVKTGGRVDSLKGNTSDQMTTLTTRITSAQAKVTKQVDAFRQEIAQLQNTLAVALQQQQEIQSIVGNYG